MLRDVTRFARIPQHFPFSPQFLKSVRSIVRATALLFRKKGVRWVRFRERHLALGFFS
jgi:hypothetical protein